MEGESSGVQQAQGQVEQGENQQQGGQEPGVDAQAGQKQNQQEPQKGAVSGGEGTDYAAQLKAKDAEIEALAKAEPWLFETKVSSQGGATGLEPAGASVGSDDQYMKRWERIAGLADESKEG